MLAPGGHEQMLPLNLCHTVTVWSCRSGLAEVRGVLDLVCFCVYVCVYMCAVHYCTWGLKSPLNWIFDFTISVSVFLTVSFESHIKSIFVIQQHAWLYGCQSQNDGWFVGPPCGSGEISQQLLHWLPWNFGWALRNPNDLSQLFL